MESQRLNTFVTWQRSVQLAAEIIKLSQTSQPRAQRFFDELADTATHYAASLGYNYLNLEAGFELWATIDSASLALYTRLKAAEISGLLPEREARRLLGLFEEVERMMENYLRAQAKAEAAQGPQARSAWKPTAQDEFMRLNGSKAPRPRREA